MESTFRSRVQDLASRRYAGPSDDVWKLREAAAVLVAFDPATLQPNGDISSADARVELLADCDQTGPVDQPALWQLRTPIRQATLRRLLAANGIEAALSRNPRPATESQQLLESVLTGKRLQAWEYAPAERQRALLEVIEWVSGLSEISARLPPIDRVKERLAWQQLLQPFRDLIGPSFAGRRIELGQLSDYVGVADATTYSESAKRTVENFFSIRERPPLFIYGPGGSGKSTLIARFVLDHADRETLRIPFAYLDFDRPGLVAEEPITLLNEIVRQLALQYPEHQSRGRELTEQWAARASEQVKAAVTEGVAAPPRFRLRDRDAFVTEFAGFVGGLPIADQPLLLVLDTFEEVQFRSGVFAEEVLDFLNLLQAQLPRLRTVLCGRGDIVSSKYKMRTVTLGNFDRDAAVAFLEGRGVDNPLVAARVFDQVGGSPLVLRLAADVARLEHVTTTDGITGLPTWLSSFWTQSIEVVLYKRILSHVYNERVKSLAYPGLILRVVTPDVLQRVLAEPCGVPIASPADAAALIAVMRQQLSTILTTGADRETLVHRADIRQILLKDLTAKSAKDSTLAGTLRQIHDAAIRYYAAFEDAARRAEELYHRLALGVDRAVLASRWMAGLTPFLGSSIKELPIKSQMYVAARLGLELPDADWSGADDEDWVLYAIRTINQKLELRRPLEAVPVVTARPRLYEDRQIAEALTRVAFAVFHASGSEYEEIRRTQSAGDARTRNMDALVSNLTAVAEKLPADLSYAPTLFKEGTPGGRIAALAVALARPDSDSLNMAIEVIRNAQSPFEQYHALRLARARSGSANPAQRAALRDALTRQEGVTIYESDPSRARIKNALLAYINASPSSSSENE